ncbi:MAG: hypothetical protein ACRCY7_07770 [Cetobacterium sp.]|uniref:hypothetical protein n=1 Tax=Cetobacterium sp. TaxID=2071632 RepID=UPI003F3BCB84
MAKVKVLEKNLPSKEENLAKMYIGPSFEAMALSHGAVVKGDIKEIYGRIIKKIPEIEKLFVKIDKDLSLKKSAVFQKGSTENYFYNLVKEKIMGGK